MTFEPAPFPDGRRALLALAVLGALALLLLWRLFSRPPDGFSFVLLVVILGLLIPIAYLAWRAWACRSLSYWIDRNAVTVAWGPFRQVIPLDKIEQMTRDQATRSFLERSVAEQGLSYSTWLTSEGHQEGLGSWFSFGPYLGRSAGLGQRLFTSLASSAPIEQMILVTPEEDFGISPADPDRFLQAVEAHHQLGPTRLLSLERHEPEVLRSDLWHDRWALGMLGAGFLFALLIVGVLMIRYPSLPPGFGQPADIPGGLAVLLPGFAVAVWIVNSIWGLLIYDRHRIGSLFLWTGTLLVQLAILVSLLLMTAV
ncbi:MAG: hypothetical protein U9R25_18370 [Chloroflexota bacterium]|nr:hypothetical protein [Chloroflexota bacterium]